MNGKHLNIVICRLLSAHRYSREGENLSLMVWVNMLALRLCEDNLLK